MMAKSFTENVKRAIRRIPRGKVATYGRIAAVAGNPRAARQVAWVLHACAEKERLPWHRVIGSRGKISLPRFGGYELQKALLEKEGVVFGPDDAIDLARYLWSPRRRQEIPVARRRGSR
jgi:methylated-DNA-protein-cysteine methyltransferase-like protein